MIIFYPYNSNILYNESINSTKILSYNNKIKTEQYHIVSFINIERRNCSPQSCTRDKSNNRYFCQYNEKIYD